MIQLRFQGFQLEKKTCSLHIKHKVNSEKFNFPLMSHDI
jgi:hypothetical protein